MIRSLLILIAFIFVVFYPCLKADFINLDDDGHILNNAAVQVLSVNSVKQIFLQTLNKTYIPLTTLTFALEKHFFGFNPFVFHLDNLLLYAAIVVLVLFLAKRLGLSQEAAFLAALIFAIHPMRVETVAWITERKDVLYAFFYLIALHLYWSYLKTFSIKYYMATFFLGLLSILSKPMALSLPLILLVLDWYAGRKFSRRVLIEKLPILIYVISIAWISYEQNMRNPIGDIFRGILIWIWSFGFYIWKFIFPFQVSPYYILPHPVNIIYWPYLLSTLLFMGLLYLLARFHQHKLFTFAFLYFFCSIFFLLRFDESDFSVVSDRFMFLPSLGICFFIGAWGDQHFKSRWGIMVLYALLVLMGIKTDLQCRIWHDSISFWDEIIQEYPDYYRAYNNRGTAEHDERLALNDFNTAIALDPKAAKAYNNRGIIYYLREDDRKAYDDFNKAISIDPKLPQPYLNRSLLEESHKNYHRALLDASYAKSSGGAVDDAYIIRLQQELRSSDRGH